MYHCHVITVQQHITPYKFSYLLLSTRGYIDKPASEQEEAETWEEDELLDTEDVEVCIYNVIQLQPVETKPHKKHNKERVDKTPKPVTSDELQFYYVEDSIYYKVCIHNIT